MLVKSRYVGQMPSELGNYIVFDTLTDGQWMVKLFEAGETGHQILCGRDNSIHDPEDYHQPNFRWVLIEPMTRSVIEKFMAVPA